MQFSLFQLRCKDCTKRRNWQLSLFYYSSFREVYKASSVQLSYFPSQCTHYAASPSLSVCLVYGQLERTIVQYNLLHQISHADGG